MIGKTLKELREARKLSQEELAKAVNMSLSSVQKWEQDKADPNTGKLIELADLFGCSIDYLFGYKDNKRDADTFVLIEKIKTLDEGQKFEVGKFIDYLRGR